MLIKILVAVIVLLFVWDLIFRSFYIHPYTHYTGRYAAFIEEKHIYRWMVPAILDGDHPVEIFFAGNSHVMDGIDPEIVERETSCRSFNLALYSLPAQNSLELLLKYQRFPRLVFIDFAARYSVYQKLESIGQQADAARRMGSLKQLCYEICDRIQWIMPSWFIPRPFFHTLYRAPKKLIKLFQTKRMDFGRYTPFRPFVSYDWALVKATNHRITRRNRQRSRWEIKAETYYLEKSIREAESLCDQESPAYKEGMAETERMIEALVQHKVRVVLMRMPLTPRLVEYENEHFPGFFNDIQILARKFNLDYVDLNSAEHCEKIGKLEFYTDGQHLIYPSCDHFSAYLSKLIKEKYIDSVTAG